MGEIKCKINLNVKDIAVNIPCFKTEISLVRTFLFVSIKWELRMSVGIPFSPFVCKAAESSQLPKNRNNILRERRIGKERTLNENFKEHISELEKNLF